MKISIIIPVYNVELYISQCIKSILNQTFVDFEAIIVNDGSTDSSIKLAKDIVKNDDRFIFLDKKNGGQGSARNMGIDHARGDFLSFIDSDDFIENQYLEKMFSQIISKNAEICLCDVNIVTNNKVTGHIKNHIKGYHNQNDFLLCRDTISSFMWDKLFKKEVFNNMRFDESIRTYEDSHFVFRLIYNHKLTSVNTPLYNYVQRPGSTTNGLNPTYLKDKKLVMDNFIKFSYQHYDKKSVFPYLSYCYLKTYVYIAIVGIIRYSPNVKTELNLLRKDLDSKFFNLKNIIKVMKSHPKICIVLISFLISPIFVRLAYQLWNKIK